MKDLIATQIETHRAKWANIARANDWYTEPFYVQVWVNAQGVVTDSLSHRDMTEDVVVNESESTECTIEDIRLFKRVDYTVDSELNADTMCCETFDEYHCVNCEEYFDSSNGVREHLGEVA